MDVSSSIVLQQFAPERAFLSFPMGSGNLEAIKYVRGSLQLLNQKLLPAEEVYDDSSTAELVFHAIRDMKVRGAPAIAISALLGLAAEVHNAKSTAGGSGYSTLDAALATLNGKLEYLFESRPTAVNLGNAVRECKEHLQQTHAKLAPDQASALMDSFIEFAEEYFATDVRINTGISQCGAAHILRTCRKDPSTKIKMLTHCNTGALATTKLGTALGVIRFVHKDGMLERAFCTETRPYNQGARLSAYECVSEGMPTTLVVDSSVSYLMADVGIDAVVVGADRVCNNGDTANKIGTYQVALAAKYHKVPFFVAVPTTTLDLSLADGSGTEIEQRPTTEITHNPQTGARVVVDSELLSVWNPSFDVTPASLISGIITENGVLLPDADGKYDIRRWSTEVEY